MSRFEEDLSEVDSAWRPIQNASCNGKKQQQQQQQEEQQLPKEELAECVAQLILDKLSNCPLSGKVSLVAQKVTISVSVYVMEDINNASIVNVGASSFGGDGPTVVKSPKISAKPPRCRTSCSTESRPGCHISCTTEPSKYRSSKVQPVKKRWPEYMAKSGRDAIAESPSVDNKNN